MEKGDSQMLKVGERAGERCGCQHASFGNRHFFGEERVREKETKKDSRTSG